MSRAAPRPSPTYSAEELTPRDWAAEEAVTDSFIDRNKAALDVALQEARASIGRGEGVSLDQALAEIEAQRRRRG